MQHLETLCEITELSDKAELFKDTFFPVPLKANLENIQHAEYSSQIESPLITEKEVEDAIRAASPFKGPRPDRITNKAL